MFTPFSLNIRGELRCFERPQVMGILNVTPDSFYAPSRADGDDLRIRIERMVAEGADIIDIGGCSTRPGSAPPGADEEIARLYPALKAAADVAPQIPVSVDTFRASVARIAVTELGASIINDISGGGLDPDMADTIAALGTPYVMMHTKGTPQTMQSLAQYTDVTAEVILSLSLKLRRFRLLGVADIIVDPGFGFAKTTVQNYELMKNLQEIAATINAPILVGISRKSMITDALKITSDEALAGTIALNMAALMKGASIIRVHDVREAAHTVKIFMNTNP